MSGLAPLSRTADKGLGKLLHSERHFGTKQDDFTGHPPCEETSPAQFLTTFKKTRGNMMGSLVAGNDRPDDNKLGHEDEDTAVSSTDAPVALVSEESVKPRTHDFEHQLTEKEHNTKAQPTERAKRRRKLRIYFP
jgi:hypothetical protein